jgi:RNA polymerase sigma factor (TIGR02999 family)
MARWVAAEIGVGKKPKQICNTLGFRSQSPSPAMNEPDITALLAAWRKGCKRAEADLVDIMYPVIKRQAVAALAAHRGSISISATELVHEIYLRLLKQRADFQNRSHFLAIAATTLRRVLMDLWRAKSIQRDAEQQMVVLALVGDAADQLPIDLFSVLQRLEALEKRDPLAARLVEMRLIAGLTNDEAADVLGVGVATAGRHFAFARAWLSK